MRIHLVFVLLAAGWLGGCASTPAGKPFCPLSKDQLSALEQRANDKDAAAQYALGELYMSDKCFDRNVPRATSLLKKSADSGNTRSMVQLGRLYRNGYEQEGISKNDAAAFQYFQQAANKGNKDGMSGLASAYRRGEGVKENKGEAIRWYIAGGRIYYACQVDYDACVREIHVAAENDNFVAQYELGRRYFSGINVDKDNQKAVYWYKQAANNGHSVAQGSLGNMYRTGNEVSRDIVKANKWLSIAAAQGHYASQNRLCGETPEKSACSAMINQYLKQYWLASIQRWANDGQSDARNLLGEMYRDGVGVTADSDEAIKWFKQAIGQGNLVAARNLCEMNPKCLKARKARSTKIYSYRSSSDWDSRQLFLVPFLFVPGLGEAILVLMMSG